MNSIIKFSDQVRKVLDSAGDWAGLLVVRLLMAYEFGSAGLMKLGASDALWGDVPNWFVGSQANAPFPFDVLPIELNWFLVTWAEILGGFALFIGLFTRFWAFSLIIVTIVAIFSVHWPSDWSSLAELWKGYAISNKGFGNYRLPLLFLAMLLALVMVGPGRLSADHLLNRLIKRRADTLR